MLGRTFKQVLLSAAQSPSVPISINSSNPEEVEVSSEPAQPTYLDIAKRRPAPTTKHTPLPLQKEDPCPICLEHGADLTFSCLHKFHKTCVLRQLESDTSSNQVTQNLAQCAMCRSAIWLLPC
eukprot:TRINITY_DN7811_c0_g2_i3.p1 TRINITY_DN7811_c0_g2~~TRINITY_DN7811_c0_g2_i3.p1  ORF type:complete len:123 (-),score=25.65 TRINITY_DN7811_c0_g2_i3:66-434(-)